MLKRITIAAVALAATTFEVQAERMAVEAIAAVPASVREDDQKRRQLEEKRAEAIAAYEKEQAQERRRMARVAQEREAHRLKLARQSRCQFKPVMTDDDMARCREVYK